MSNEKANPFLRLTVREVDLCMMCGERAAQHARDWFREKRGMEVEMNPTLIGMDFAIAHLASPIDLERLLKSSSFDFLEDYGTIAKNIDRTLAFFPAHVKLRFANSGIITL